MISNLGTIIKITTEYAESDMRLLWMQCLKTPQELHSLVVLSSKKIFEETPMSRGLMQYTCCHWDVIDKTSYNKPQKNPYTF